MRIGHIALTLPLLLVALVPPMAACSLDPVHDNLVSQLGPEAPNIPKGEFHRAGQACVVCHGDEGPASEKFAIAGTVFYGPGTSSTVNGQLMGAGSVSVYIEDGNGQTLPAVATNCVGNFWIRASDYPGGAPQYPVLITISGPMKNGAVTGRSMVSQIGREPSCGLCHQVQSYPNQPGAITNYYETPGVIYLTGDDPTYMGDPMTCSSSPVNPPIPVGLAPVSP